MSKVIQVPEGWKLTSFGAVINNKTKKADSSIPVPIIDLEHIEQETGRLILNSWQVDYPKDKVAFEEGNILFGKLRPYLKKFWFCTFPGACTSELLVIQAKKSVDCKYIYYVSHTDLFMSHADRFSYGTKMPRVSMSDLKSFSLGIPENQTEQHRIAEILSTLDRAIEASEKLIAKEKQIKKGLMSDLLTHGIDEAGRIRTPQTHRYKESELGMIPEGWEVKPLGKCVLGNGEYGINAPAVDYSYTLPTYLRITDIDDEGHFVEQDKKSVLADDANDYLLEKGDIVFARTGNTTGKTYLYNSKDGALVFAGFLIRFRPDPKKLLSPYLKAITETERYWAWVQTNSARTGQPGINANEYARFTLALPIVEEQQRIADILTAQNKKIETEEANLAKLKELKKGLMDDLLSGRVRVKV